MLSATVKNEGCDTLTFLTIKDTLTTQESNLNIFGHEPAISLVRSQVQTDPGSYILIIPGTMSVKVVFAAGDVQNVLYRQAVYGGD